jgi:nicotinamidase-related amidase
VQPALINNFKIFAQIAKANWSKDQNGPQQRSRNTQLPLREFSKHKVAHNESRKHMNTHIPIVRIFYTDGPNTESNPFSRAGGLIRPLKELMQFDAAIEFEKHKHSALIDTGLKGWLHVNGIQKLILCGIRTEQCCETTARHASDEGWEVAFASKAMLTFDMTHPNGQVVTAEEITLRTETVLAGRFATLV